MLLDGGVVPWIIASECVIQQNCTTAIEAFMLGKSCFSFVPQYDCRYDSSIVNKITNVYEEVIKLSDDVCKIIKGECVDEKKKNYKDALSPYLTNVDMTKNVFDELLVNIDNIGIKENTSFKLINYLVQRNILDLKEYFKNFRRDTRYRDSKYKRIRLRYFYKLACVLSTIEHIDYTSIRIKRLSGDIFLLEKK